MFKRSKKQPDREKRIDMEIVVDCYERHERAMGWADLMVAPYFRSMGWVD